MRALAITLNMDSITEYSQKHRIPISAEDPLLMYRQTLDRFTGLCEDLGAVGTLFVVSRDITGLAAEKLKALVYKGFEIASHSHHHNPRLSQLKPGEILKELRLSKAMIESTTGVPLRGFRAPGHHLSAPLMQELIGLGFHYDSSVIPSASYYAARAISIVGQKLTTRQSSGMLGNPRVVKAPRVPYRPASDPYEGGGDSNIIELPLSVATALGVPVSASTMQEAPKRLKSAMLDSLKQQDVVVLGFEAMDFVDPNTDGLPPALQTCHPLLKHPVEERIAFLRAWLGELMEDRWALTCAQLADQFS